MMGVLGRLVAMHTCTLAHPLAVAWAALGCPEATVTLPLARATACRAKTQSRETPGTMERYNGGVGGKEADPCQNHHCKHGKVCEVDEDNNPMCVCQNPSNCPPSTAVFEKVCGTDNKTYETSCHFFATKCTLEGTKKGHKLHLDYIGPCKLIPDCHDAELGEFPLRMRDWLKNVLVTLYERDESNNLLTEKQKLRVKKIHENEKRLEAGDHPVELLARDFEKNYNMYIFPVHWQFGQLDQHPNDGYLSHTELAPLRAPLIPMEHCTTRFFDTCDLDGDKYIALEEWASCFGIKEKDIDKDLVI
ncbi:UNVERIFIED_CONTAM: hypothetical protein K2H54_037010 [Gekko kuhli]